MVTQIFEIGSISSRGQIAIPSEIRKQLDLSDGSRVLFFVEQDAVIMKKITSETFASITKPLRDSPKKINEGDVTEAIHRLRKQWRE